MGSRVGEKLQIWSQWAIAAPMDPIELIWSPLDCHWSSIIACYCTRTDAILVLADSAPAARALVRTALLNMVVMLWREL